MADMHKGHRARLRQRFIKAGLEGFAPHEVLELLLTFAIPRRDTNPIAHALIRRFGSLHGVFEAKYAELIKVEGIGEQAATLISLMLPTMRKYLLSKGSEKTVLTDISSYKSFARSLLIGETYEHFEVVSLDAKSCVISTERVASGDEGLAMVSIRRVISFLLRSGSAAALIAHNHPQGDAQPSKADIELTDKINSLCIELGITLLDHVIIAGTKAFSFRENNLL
ncbi:MAG: JAB domain-containing protein [Christensenellales bacterium]|jgi:DNA repair protein RadC|nr:DNA repair protein RadC [Christensenellaceae bacterium]